MPWLISKYMRCQLLFLRRFLYSRNVSPYLYLCVDRVIKTIIRTGTLQKKDSPLIAAIVRDAEKLSWRPGQLERRKRAIQATLSKTTKLMRAWKDNEDDDFLRRAISSEDALFKKKGWNEVDSGFRLWGGGRMDAKAKSSVVDEFFERKGWNDVDSGFRII